MESKYIFLFAFIVTVILLIVYFLLIRKKTTVTPVFNGKFTSSDVGKTYIAYTTDGIKFNIEVTDVDNLKFNYEDVATWDNTNASYNYGQDSEMLIFTIDDYDNISVRVNKNLRNGVQDYREFQVLPGTVPRHEPEDPQPEYEPEDPQVPRLEPQVPWRGAEAEGYIWPEQGGYPGPPSQEEGDCRFHRSVYSIARLPNGCKTLERRSAPTATGRTCEQVLQAWKDSPSNTKSWKNSLSYDNTTKSIVQPNNNANCSAGKTIEGLCLNRDSALVADNEAFICHAENENNNTTVATCTKATENSKCEDGTVKYARSADGILFRTKMNGDELVYAMAPLEGN